MVVSKDFELSHWKGQITHSALVFWMLNEVLCQSLLWIELESNLDAVYFMEN
jgi:hypothetical protein